MQKLQPGLYVVATPIGQLADTSERAKQVLSGVELICAEDTRKTAALLKALQISKPPLGLMALHAHNERQQSLQILEHLRSGRSVAMVSDAGTPGVSDPGARLVDQAWQEGLPVLPIPGPSALTAALSVCGFWSSEDQPVTFWGFLPSKTAARRTQLAEMGRRRGISIVFEAPHRLEASLQEASEVLGDDCQMLLCREMTKPYETFIRGSIPEVLARRQAGLEQDSHSGQGEHVLVFDIKPSRQQLAQSPLSMQEWADLLREACPPTASAKILAKAFQLDRQQAYDFLEALEPAPRDKSTK
jgi:16S rRNA (cytidine1402-2'-O)-methyltransferase